MNLFNNISRLYILCIILYQVYKILKIIYEIIIYRLLLKIYLCLSSIGVINENEIRKFIGCKSKYRDELSIKLTFFDLCISAYNYTNETALRVLLEFYVFLER